MDNPTIRKNKMMGNFLIASVTQRKSKQNLLKMVSVFAKAQTRTSEQAIPVCMRRMLLNALVTKVSTRSQ